LSFPEPTGYWIRGRSTTEVTYATALRALTIALLVRCGPVQNQVLLTTPDWQQGVVVESGATAAVTVPTMARSILGLRLTPLRISVSNGFVPAEIDPTAADRRLLGCWLSDGSLSLSQHTQRVDAGRPPGGGQ
jgi:hypothetical protein